MKKLTIALLAMLTFNLLPNVLYAATSEVTWTDYENYRDIHPGSEGRKHFRERMFESFDKHFAKLAKVLPEGHVLKINVTDLDLAGDTHSGGINQLRVIKDIYFPRINFSYELVNTDGSIITSGEIVLKDMNFMMGSNSKYRNQSLSYEKVMLDDWFAKSFKELVVETK